MLTIRNAQMEVLRKAALNQFIFSTAARLRTDHPAKAAAFDDERLRDLVRLAAEKAPRYGIDKLTEVARFAAHLLLRGADFDQNQADQRLQEILNDPEMHGWERLDELEYHFS